MNEPKPTSSNQMINEVYLQLLDVQRNYRNRIIKELPAPLAGGPPDSYILESEIIPFSPRIFREICLRIAPLLAAQVPGEDYIPFLSGLSDSTLEQLALALQQVPEQDVTAALELAVEEVRMHKLSSLDRRALHMLLLAAFVPFFSAFAHQQNLDLGRWHRGWCPVCGQFPVNGYNRPGDGGRILGCWMCECEWSFTRQGCPVCSNPGSQGTLFLIPEKGDRNRRIQVCEDCGHYLKISDYAQASEKCDLQMENAATLYLDVLAQRQGYRPASRPFNDKQ